MRRAAVLSFVVLAVAAAGPATPAPVLARTDVPAIVVADGALPIAARGARGFGRSRSRSARRPLAPRRSRPGRSLGRSILRALGIAWLLSVLFGWGAGGSPLGLLLLLALAFLVVRSLRRRRHYAW
jgi:hypothetical protein